MNVAKGAAHVLDLHLSQKLDLAAPTSAPNRGLRTSRCLGHIRCWSHVYTES